MRWAKVLGLGAAALLLAAGENPGPLTRDDYAKAVFNHLSQFGILMVVYGKSDQGNWSVRQAIDRMTPTGACKLQAKLGEKFGGTGSPVSSVALDWAQIVPTYDSGMVVLRSGEGPNAARLELLTNDFPGTEKAIADEMQALRLLCSDAGGQVPANPVRDLDTVLVQEVSVAKTQELIDNDFDPRHDIAVHAIGNFDPERCRLALIARDMPALNLRGATVRIDNDSRKVLIEEGGGVVHRIGFYSHHQAKIVETLRLLQRDCAPA